VSTVPHLRLHVVPCHHSVTMTYSVYSVKLPSVVFMCVEDVTTAMYRQAYLVFSSKEQVDDAIKNFKRLRPRLDDRRLILIRWNPKRVLPTGSVYQFFVFYVMHIFLFQGFFILVFSVIGNIY